MERNIGPEQYGDEFFQYTINWLRDERKYQLNKFDYPEQIRKLKEDQEALQFWVQQFYSYIQRVPILQLDNPNGRQAAAKFASTAVAFIETLVAAFGPLPEPGVPSGENLDNLRKLTSEGTT